MGIQARMTESDQRLYNVGRDVAHNFAYVARAVATTLEDRPGPALDDMLDHYGCDDAQLGLACQAFTRFILTAVELPAERMADGLARCGWFELPPAAQLAVMVALGRVTLGLHWAGVRESTLGGVGPVLTYQDLQARGEECARLMALPPWRRRLYKFTGRLRRVWAALRGRA